MRRTSMKDQDKAAAWDIVYRELRKNRIEIPFNLVSDLADALNIIKELVETPDYKSEAAISTLNNMGYTYNGGALWRPPLGKAPVFEEDLRPFDLEAAKRGEAVVTRSGQSVRFLTHVPEISGCNVMVYVEGSDSIDSVTEQGCYWENRFKDNTDIFMAPKPKKTVWVNLYKGGEARWSTDKVLAERGYDSSVSSVKLGRAIPVQIYDAQE